MVVVSISAIYQLVKSLCFFNVDYVPLGVSEQAIVQFFNGALLAAAGVDYSVASASGQFPVLKAEIGPRRPDAAGQVSYTMREFVYICYQADHRYCFLEFRTIADANICLKLDGTMNLPSMLLIIDVVDCICCRHLL